ncbi:MAG: hypothetical protein RR315_07595 [Oscillospiraceae bacterium]
MDSLIRINAIVNKALSGNPEMNGQSIIMALKNAPPADITIFPALAIMPPSSKMLFTHRDYIEKCSHALEEIISVSAEKEGYLICGLPVIDCGRTVSAIAVIAKGKLLGLLPDFNDYENLSTSFSSQFLPVWKPTVLHCLLQQLRYAFYCLHAKQRRLLPYDISNIPQGNCRQRPKLL